MVKLPPYSYSILSGPTPCGPFTCIVDKIKSEAGSPGLTGEGTSFSLRGTVCPFIFSEEGDVAAAMRHSAVLV